MRERKRDWPVIVYKFWARPINEIPQELWNLAHAINDLWNLLVEKCTVARDRAGAVESKELKKEIWNSFWIEARKHVRAADLNWEMKGEILDRFTSASRRAVKEHTELQMHRGIRRVMIPHRFTGGGIPVAKIFNVRSTSKRLKVEPVSDDAYRDNSRASIRRRLTRGVFGLGTAAQIEFETILHRRISTNAMLKKALWVGEFDRSLPESRRWSWSLQLVCEIPDEDYFRKAPVEHRPCCGIDFGWRLMSEGDYLRIGMIVDTLGRAIELRLPLSMERRRDRKKKDWVSSLKGLLALDSKIDLELEAAKSQLAQNLSEKPPGFEKMRQGGLLKLLRESKDPKVMEVLSVWSQRNTELCGIRANIRGRMLRRKSWLYQNLAAWIASTYQCVMMKRDTPVKTMSMRIKDHTFRESAKYRQWAALGELRAAIKHAVRRSGGEVFEIDPYNTTRSCYICSAEYIGSKKTLYLECLNGHRWDQDVNAAMNILSSHLGAASKEAEELRKTFISRSRSYPDIPENVKSVAVPYTSE